MVLKKLTLWMDSRLQRNTTKSKITIITLKKRNIFQHVNCNLEIDFFKNKDFKIKYRKKNHYLEQI